jgi:hypothetical protein
MTVAKSGTPDLGASPAAEVARAGAKTPGAIEDERDFCLRSLRDLDAEWEAGDIDAADYRALKDAYTARAAAALHALDGRPASTAAAARAV